MKIKNTDINDIKPYDKNPRNNANSIDKVADSIAEFGFRQPIVVDEDMIVLAGHTRLLASKQLGLKKVPVHIAEGLTNAQKKAYRIMDNKSSEDSEWDKDLLNLEIKDLIEDNYDLNMTGFTPEQIDALSVLTESILEGETDEDSVPEPPKEPKSKHGDIYELGHHRLMCGDSISIDDVDKLMDGKKADMVFTDPPYNINFKGTLGCTSKMGKIITQKDGYSSANSNHADINNDKLTKEDFREFITDVLHTIKENCNGGWYICFSSKNLEELLNPLIDSYMRWKSIIIWNKNQSPMGGGHFRKKYEPLVYGYMNNVFYGKEYAEDDVWDVKRTLKNDIHPTMKPVELVQKAIKFSSKEADIVLDLFGGSGSTLIASEATARKCYMMELDPIYVDVIVKRWEDFTGKKAKLING